MRKRWLMLLVLLGLLPARPVLAQGNLEHRGFYFGIGLGIGWAKLGGDFSDGESQSGLSGHLRLGGTVKPNLLLGGETNGWFDSEDGIDNSWGSLMGTVTYYPGEKLPLFVKGGAGYMTTSGTDGFDDYGSNHFAFQVGAGYDIKVGSNKAITVVANLIQGLGGSFDVSGVEFGDASPRIIQVGAAFSLY
jgi:opacity protein-like surface antigen